MSELKIIPEKVNKPIQLLAAWLVGLILVNGSFLLGAEQIARPAWASAMLVIAAVANVPLFIGSLFLLQTKFRPQMQEDAYYSQYLEREKNSNATQQTTLAEDVENEVVSATDKIVKTIGVVAQGKEQPIAQILRASQNDILVAKYGGLRTLAELHLSPDTWDCLVDRWSKDPYFIKEADALLEEGLVEKKYRGYRRCKLTPLGVAVAQDAERQMILYNQQHPSAWERQRRQLQGDDA